MGASRPCTSKRRIRSMSSFESACEFNRKYRDRITGFEGHCTGIAFYPDQDAGALLTPTLDNDGRMRPAHWFPQSRLEAVDDSRRLGTLPGT